MKKGCLPPKVKEAAFSILDCLTTYSIVLAFKRSHLFCQNIAEQGKILERQGFPPRAVGNAALGQPFLCFLAADAEGRDHVVFHGLSPHGERSGGNAEKQVFILNLQVVKTFI